MRIWRRLRGRADRVLPEAVRYYARGILRSLGDGPVFGTPPGSEVVVVAPHPDDESIMCGGTVAALVARGAVVTLVAVTDGERGGDPTLSSVESGTRRRLEQERAAETLGFDSIVRCEVPDGSVSERIPELVERLESVFADRRPGAVLTPWWLESHADHAAVARAVAAAVDGGVEVWAGEVWTPLLPNRIVDVTAHIDLKRAAIDCYPTAGAALDLESLAALSRYRSAFGMGGQGHAEAFIALTGNEFRAAVGP